jgi:predicted membrane channel-forming protein YqfA (hemolysin III family)
MRKILASLILAAAAFAVPASAADQKTPQEKLDRLLTGLVAGKPTSCINLASATSSQVVDGRAIVYRVGGTLYVNEPRSGADTLNSDDVLVTNTFGNQLCSIDTVKLIDRSTRFQHGFVILGDFVPYTRVKQAK